MYMSRLAPLMAIVPFAALLTASFFVLFVMSKIEEKALKGFGFMVVGFLWLAALVVFSGAVFMVDRRPVPMKCVMQHRMRMNDMSQMMKSNSSSMVIPNKGSQVKNEKHSGMTKCAGNKGIISKAE